MTALEYMEQQVRKHRNSFQRAALKGAPAEELENIRIKIWHYIEAAQALRSRGELEFDYNAEV